MLPPACWGVWGHLGKSQRHSDCHSRAFLSQMPCFSGGEPLPLGPSPCLAGRDGHSAWGRDGGMEDLHVACQGGAVRAAAWPGVSSPCQCLLPQPVNLQAGSTAVSQGQVTGVLGSPGDADLSPQFRTACFSSGVLCAWPGCRRDPWLWPGLPELP